MKLFGKKNLFEKSRSGVLRTAFEWELEFWNGMNVDGYPTSTHTP